MLTLPPIHISNPSQRADFEQDLKTAFEGLLSFARDHGWSALVNEQLIEKVMVFENKTDFDLELISLSSGQLKEVPPTYTGLMDHKILRVLSWEAYRKVHPDHSRKEYIQLLQHEMAHQLHTELVGDEGMGPTWFYEGFAVLAAGQYRSAPELSPQAIAALLQSTERGNYPEYGSLMRHLLKKHELSDMVTWAQKGTLLERLR